MNRIVPLKPAEQKLHSDFFKYGYPLEMFCTKEIVESLTCAICIGVYRNPVTSNTCGHTFCKQCFEDLKIKSGSSPACPDCRNTITSTVETFAIKSSIQSQRVKCPLKVLQKLPCDWEGKLDLLESHLENDCKEIPRPKLKGYPPEIFVNIASKDTMTCNQCKGIFRDPVLVECGHTFCRICITEYEEQKNSASKEAGKKLCPDCFKEYTGYFPVFQTQKMIGIMQVICTAKECSWKGTAEEWEIHRNSCKEVLKGRNEGKISAQSNEEARRRANGGQVIVQVNQQVQNNNINIGQDQVPQRPASRHQVLDVCEGCCSGIEKVIKFILLGLLKIVLTIVAFGMYISIFGYIFPFRDPSIVMAFILMASSMSSGWLLFFGVVAPMSLFVLVDMFRFIKLDCSLFNVESRGIDWISLRYICYLLMIYNDTTFAAFSQQEKERITNLWYHLYWWIMKSGIYIITLIWTAIVDESYYVKDYSNLILACRIVLGVNLLIDALDYFLTFRRIRRLHRQHNL